MWAFLVESFYIKHTFLNVIFLIICKDIRSYKMKIPLGVDEIEKLSQSPMTKMTKSLCSLGKKWAVFG